MTGSLVTRVVSGLPDLVKFGAIVAVVSLGPFISAAAIASLVGGGIVAGNLMILLIVALSDEVALKDVANALLITSAVMLTVACSRASNRRGVRSGSIPPRP